MSSWRTQGHRRQRDVNEPKIVKALSKSFRVLCIDDPCDLVVQCRHGEWKLVEVKNPDSPGRSRRKNPEGLTEKQQRIRDTLFAPIPTVETASEAVELMEAWCRWHGDGAW